MRFFVGCAVAIAAFLTTAFVIWSFDKRASHDPAEKMFWLEQRLAEGVVARKDVLLPADADQAPLRWCIAERLTTAPQIVVLGSSHTLTISSKATSPFSVANFSISGGSLPDHLVTTQILASQRKRARVWLVLVDPWYFDRQTDFYMWQTRPEELVRMETALSELSAPPLAPLFRTRAASIARQKLSPTYSLSPLTAAADNFLLEHFTTILAADRAEGLGTVLLSDGSIQPRRDRREPKPEEVAALARSQFASNQDRHRYGNFEAVDSELWTLFERWLQFLQADGSRVLLMLSPYHPAIYGHMISNPKNQLQTVEKKVRSLAEIMHIPLVGSYDPVRTGVAATDFLDGDHLQEDQLAKLVGDPLRALANTTAGEVPIVPNVTVQPPSP